MIRIGMVGKVLIHNYPYGAYFNGTDEEKLQARCSKAWMLAFVQGRHPDPVARNSRITHVWAGVRDEAERIADLRISAYYSGRRTADGVLADLTESYSAPRQLAVVSSDRAVQRQAKRRRCKVIEASAFARQLKARPADEANGEPAAKRHGLEEGRLEHWLEEFGFVGENDSE